MSGALLLLSIAFKSGGNKSVIDGNFPALSKGNGLLFDVDFVELGGGIGGLERLVIFEFLSKTDFLDFLDKEPPPKKSSQEESPLDISATPPTFPLFFGRSSMGGGRRDEKESFGVCRW
jgi:hypothetical protein